MPGQTPDSRVERAERGEGGGTARDALHGLHVLPGQTGQAPDSRVERAEREVCIERLQRLASAVGQIAYGVHEHFGVGLLEKVYENALAHRLEKAGFQVERQKPLAVFDIDGFCAGEYFCDLIVNGELIVELKAVRTLAPEHLAQTLNYLKITSLPVGLLVNFGSYKFERRTVVSR